MATASHPLKPEVLEELENSRKANICDLEGNQKRWLFVGIYLHKIVSPVLRKYVKPELDQLWQTLKSSKSIDTQQYPRQLIYPQPTTSGPTRRLNYEPINNNKITYGDQRQNYDYRVLSPVDLSKLFLLTHMAHYTAFDDSCDSSALLGMITNIGVFQQKVKVAAKKIREELRNPWAHCNFTQWNDTKYKDSIKLIETFLRSLQLPRDDEDELFLLFNGWIGHGEEIINGSTPEQELVTTVRNQIHAMVQNVNVIAGNHQEQIEKLQTELTNVDKVLVDHSSRINTLEETVNMHSEEINRQDEQITSAILRQYQVELQLNDPVPINIREQIKKELEQWMEKDQKYVPTRATKHVLSIVQDKSCVTITGPSGCGKTFTARHTALFLKEQGYDIIPIYAPTDIRDYYKPNRQTCFIVDDICGNFTANQQQIGSWRQVLPVIENIVNDKSCKIIVSCRLQIFNDDRFKSLKPFNSCKCNLVSSDNRLTRAEKSDLIKIYTNMTISEREIEEYLECVGPLLPLLCSLYRADSGVSVMQFLKNPFDIIEDHLNNLFDQQEDEGKYKICALALVVLFNNKLKDQWFEDKKTSEQKELLNDLYNACGLPEGLSKKTIQTHLKTLLDSYIQKDNTSYKAVHDKIFDFLAWYFGEKMIECLIDFGEYEFINERMLCNLETCGKSDVDCDKSEDFQFIIYIPGKYLTNYFNRLKKEWIEGEVIKVFDNFHMRNELFRKEFLNYLKHLEGKEQIKLVSIKDKGKQRKWYSYRLGSTALLESCYHRYKDFIEWILSMDVDVNQSDDNKRTALYWACKNNHLDMVSMLLEKNPDVNQTERRGRSPLYWACVHNNLNMVMNLIEKNSDVNQTDDFGRSPLLFACNNDNLDMVSMLLKRNPDVNKSDKSGESPLYYACRNNNLDIVMMLFKKNPDVNQTGMNGQSPLHMACNNSNLYLVKRLLDKNPDVNKIDNYGQTPLSLACKNNDIDIVRMLLEKKPDVNNTDRLERSPLYWACENDNLDMVSILLKRNPDVNQTDRLERSPLFWACENDNLDMVRILLERNSDVNKTVMYGGSPLHWACENYNLHMVGVLLEVNPDVNQTDEYGRSPLYLACENNNLNMVSILLKRNPDVNKTDTDGQSPLYWACRNNNLDMVKMLLQRNPDVNKTDKYGKSPLYWACENNNIDMESILLERNPNVNQTDHLGQSPLYWTCKNNNYNMVRMLLVRNPDVNKTGSYGQSPMYWACENNNLQMVRILLERDADVNNIDMLGQSPLHLACLKNNLDMVSVLLTKNPDVNLTDEWGESPLYSACRNNNLEMARMLLEMNPDVTLSDKNGRSPLYFACKNNNKDMVKMLLEINPGRTKTFLKQFKNMFPKKD